MFVEIHTRDLLKEHGNCVKNLTKMLNLEVQSNKKITTTARGTRVPYGVNPDGYLLVDTSFESINDMFSVNHRAWIEILTSNVEKSQSKLYERAFNELHINYRLMAYSLVDLLKPPAIQEQWVEMYTLLSSEVGSNASPKLVLESFIRVTFDVFKADYPQTNTTLKEFITRAEKTQVADGEEEEE